MGLDIDSKKKVLDTVIQEYVNVFCKKHDIQFDYWVADLSGTICQMGDFFINFEDIRLDLETDQPKNQIFEWYEVTLDLALKNKPTCNYYSWINGFRPKS